MTGRGCAPHVEPFNIELVGDRVVTPPRGEVPEAGQAPTDASRAVGATSDCQRLLIDRVRSVDIAKQQCDVPQASK